MAKAQCINLEVIQKSTPSYELVFTEDDVALDITGWTIYFTVKQNMNDTDANAVINKKITTHSDPTNGKTLITLTNTETNLTGNYYYAVDYKDDEGNEDTLYYGRIRFQKSTRSTRN